MVCNKVKILKISLVAVIANLAIVASSFSLPFNDDMVHSKNSEGRHMYYSTGQIMRAKPEGVVSVGQLDYTYTSREETDKLKNPTKLDQRSWKIGKRLFKVNCSPCHGNIEANTYEPGPAGKKLLKAPPDLGSDPYIVPKTDGHYYGVLQFGFGLMPAIGWKMSPSEHWNIISYVRQVQQKRAGQGK
jgi:mono/diheme cytochrome c family protein